MLIETVLLSIHNICFGCEVKILIHNLKALSSKGHFTYTPKQSPVIFLPARPASQTHDSNKGRMILNHVNPAGRIKNCGEKSAFKNLQLSF